jgi:hypothetical protein
MAFTQCGAWILQIGFAAYVAWPPSLYRCTYSSVGAEAVLTTLLQKTGTLNMQ